MNKSELIKKIQGKTVIGTDEAKRTLKAFEEVIAEELANGKTVQMVGFGTFKVNERKARTGRNPQTGETLKIPAKKVPTFKAGKLLKEAVN